MKNCSRFINLLFLTPPEERTEVIKLFDPDIHTSPDHNHVLFTFDDDSHVIVWIEGEGDDSQGCAIQFEETDDLNYFIATYGLPTSAHLREGEFHD